MNSEIFNIIFNLTIYLINMKVNVTRLSGELFKILLLFSKFNISLITFYS